MDALIESIKKHEGLRLYPYQDSLGFWTIGYGRCIEKKGITPQEADMMLQTDIDASTAQFNTLPDRVKDACNSARMETIIEMIFQLGFSGTMRFRKMFTAIEARDFERASMEMLDSRWARQTPGRCRELAETMRTGEV
jgi:lysozyme